jgi:hypothetical protein
LTTVIKASQSVSYGHRKNGFTWLVWRLRESIKERAGSAYHLVDVVVGIALSKYAVAAAKTPKRHSIGGHLNLLVTFLPSETSMLLNIVLSGAFQFGKVCSINQVGR